MEYNDAEKLMAQCEDAFVGMDVMVISTLKNPVAAGVSTDKEPETREEIEAAAKAVERSYSVAMDFVGPIMPVQIEVLNNLAEKARGDYAILPQEGSVTRVQFN